jgi:cation transport protein ChaC
VPVDGLGAVTRQVSPRDEYEATRERLAKGILLESVRADAPPGVRVRTDAELAASLEETLRHHQAHDDLHVFGCGSLMWNPALDAAQATPACVHGWHRRFCLRMLFGRGTAETPGAMLALDRGGACHGLLFRIAAAKARAEAQLLWRREMLAGSYDARWVRVRAGGATLRAIAFVANRQHERYIGGQPVAHIAHLIRTGRGSLGTSRAYFDRTVRALEQLGVRDRGIERLRRAILLADLEDTAR